MAQSIINLGTPAYSDQFVPSTLVLAINHSGQAADLTDPQETGKEHEARFYHIKTPLAEGSLVMYRYSLLGYAFGACRPLDIVWVGYLYNNPKGPPISTYTKCRHNIPGMHATAYTKEGFLYLKFGPVDRYCNAFELHYQGHYSNAKMGLKFSEYSVTAEKN